MANQLLSQNDYIKLLELRFKNPEIKFENAEFKSLTENLDGFLGEHNILQISYSLNGETKTTNFFVKSKPRLEDSAKLANELLVFEREIFFYEKLFKEYERRGYNTSFAPTTYLCKNNEILVMNNLKSEGYYTAGRTNFFDLETTKSSLRSLAYFHGASIMYEEEKSKELNQTFRLGLEYFEELKERILRFEDTEGVGYHLYHNSKDCFIELIKIFDETKDWKDDFIQRLNNLNFLEIFTHDLGVRKTLIHGDLWTNNMLFKQQNGETRCCIIDYQTMKYYNLAFDVLYIMYVNMRKELRDEHMDALCNYYYDSLEEILNKRNLTLENIISRKDYFKSIKYYKLLARFHSACAHTIIFVDVDKLKDIIGDRSIEQLLREDRTVVITEMFKCDKYFADIMKENLYEMREILLSNDANID